MGLGMRLGLRRRRRSGVLRGDLRGGGRRRRGPLIIKSFEMAPEACLSSFLFLSFFICITFVTRVGTCGDG